MNELLKSAGKIENATIRPDSYQRFFKVCFFKIVAD